MGLSRSEFKGSKLTLHVDPLSQNAGLLAESSIENQNGMLAVKCFEFLHISAERERELGMRFDTAEI